jgi:hypothetical protein
MIAAFINPRKGVGYLNPIPWRERMFKNIRQGSEAEEMRGKHYGTRSYLYRPCTIMKIR